MSDQIILRAICAGCHAVIREGTTTPDGHVSHGTCRICAAYTINQMNIDDYWKGEFYANKTNENQGSHQAQGR